jgi:DHA1 family tetracycline resistance protein-like MFS transporter
VALAAAVGVAVKVPAGAPAGPRTRAGVTTLVTQMRRASFLRPVLLLAAGTGALSAGVGFLPLLGIRHHLDTVATGALVSLLAATTAVIQPGIGRRHDAGRLPVWAPSAALVSAAAGFGLAVAFPGAAGIAAAALLIGAGVAVVTPVGFSLLAAGSPPEMLGRTMGAGEVGRELGDAGGPVLVGAFGALSLGAGLAAIATALVASAALAVPWRRDGTGLERRVGAGAEVTS